ncbi:hypothetical protein LNV23_02455 [Paucibacter sp. DJ1R-11]|uniref:hypothetical protein n=1 Tax=Paucibacter sp. DJ1R-11 TaxID=2893556 RepID=UPI0021E3F711|nr:hypothetical protein [Paucibacter sp. DJ1R-11]MCV2362308.1 hypothetical protein [Paucibacter sp. DJ1R-11]
MTTLTLTFNGAPLQARQALGELLLRFKSAYFVERSNTEFLVTADEATASELARQKQWSSAVSHSEAGKSPSMGTVARKRTH